ncbi:MAG: tetratricopeptide repeat protein [Pseudomonadales bacterium]|nr:tetratricopeptide repeat protein [Pseudomonadales bacterium]
MKIDVIIKSGFIFGLAIISTACSLIRLDTGFSYDDALEKRIIDQQEDRFAEIDLLALDAEIIDYLDAHFNALQTWDTEQRTWDKVSLLQELLFSEEHLNIQYEDSANYTAIEVFHQQKANCLALMNLYIAMARHLGIDANYHTVKVRPSWDRRGELLVISEHINATGRVSHDSRYIVDFTPEVSLQQLTAAIVSDQHARALYFNNLGVEKLIAGDIKEALPFFKNALWLEPELEIAWNNIGAAYNRLAEFELAEYSYKRSFDLDNTTAAAIGNLARLYSSQGNTARAERYFAAIERFNKKNPYYHYLLGNDAYNAGNYKQAEKHYINALRRKQVEPDFYYALGLTYGELGQEVEANQLMQLGRAVQELGDQVYRSSNQQARLIQNNNSILRQGSSGISIVFNQGEY